MRNSLVIFNFDSQWTADIIQMNKFILLIFFPLQILNVFNVYGIHIAQQKCEAYQKKISTSVGNASTEFPFMARIVIKNRNYNGILISEKFVLTAITIAFNSPAKKHIILGDLQSKTSKARQTFEVIKEICHPEFNFPINNLKLLKLNASVKFNEYIQPACLSHLQTTISERLIEIGRDGRSGSKSSLHRIKFNLISNCKDAMTEFSYKKYMRGLQCGLNFCASAKKGDRDFCDTSGGTALLNAQISESNLNEIIGMTSFNFGCGNDGFPLVFIRISLYVEWIESIVWPSKNEGSGIVITTLSSIPVPNETLLLIAVIKNFLELILFVLAFIVVSVSLVYERISFK